VLPFMVGADAGSRDLFGLFDETLQRLLDANR
jgi:zinc/manganese transport system substrate-binding protein